MLPVGQLATRTLASLCQSKPRKQMLDSFNASCHLTVANITKQLSTGCNMGRKKQGKFVRPDNKGKDKRHKMKGKSLETFTEEMHTAFEGKMQ